MVTKKTLVLGFATFIILGFLIGVFAPIMWVPEEKPSPTPTEGEPFSGSGMGQATIAGLGADLYVECDSEKDLTKELEAVPGVGLVFKPFTEKGYSVSLDAESGEENASRAVAAIQELLERECAEYAALRSAVLVFSEKVVLHADLPSTETMELHPVDLKNKPGFVLAGRQANDSVTVAVFAVFDASGRGTVTIEELQTRAEVREVEEGGEEEGGNEAQKNESEGE